MTEHGIIDDAGRRRKELQFAGRADWNDLE